MKLKTTLLGLLGSALATVAWAWGPAPKPTGPAAAAAVRGRAYTSRDDVAAYLWTFGDLPPNYITKAEAQRLGWRGGPLEPYAPGKSIGGDRFGNYEQQLPKGRWRECDIDTRGKPRGAKRLVYSEERNPRTIYYTGNHYKSFERLDPRPAAPKHAAPKASAPKAKKK